MTYQHSNVYIVRVVDTAASGEAATWFVGPYGSTRADQLADELESAARACSCDDLTRRDCFVEQLYSDDACLRVTDYDRRIHQSLY